MLKSLLLSIFLVLLPSCVYQKKYFSTIVKTEEYEPIFVSMPQSGIVFENIASIVYRTIYDHFSRVGYSLATQSLQGYELRSVIKKLEPYQKYVSPDVLLFHTEVKLEILCQLYDYAQRLVAEKTFYFFTLISRPRTPILTSSFLRFEFEKLMKRSVPRIEQYFRPFLKRKSQEE
ncbi:MAG: hypothetical protein V1855_03910 [bacterium]